MRRLLVVALAAACASTPPPRPAAPAAPGEWQAATRRATRIDGLVPLWRREDGSLLVEVAPPLLGRDLGLLVKVRGGVAGGAGLIDGAYLSDTRVVRFARVGARLLLVDRNLRARAEPGSGWERSVAASAGDSILAALPIVAGDGATLLADVTAFVLSDYGDLAEELRPIYEPRTASLDDKRSLVTGAAGYPRNVEIDALLTYAAPTQPAGLDGAADGRALSVGVRYSLFALPEPVMAGRVADDRVGYFADLIQDPSRGTHELYAQLRRRRLEKRDPAAPRSRPKAPIVYYLDPSIPLKWRPYVREGILAWNRALEEAGFEEAIVVRDAPDDGSVDPEDVRYSVVRWVNAYNHTAAGIAYHHVDPRSGEILDSDILLLGPVINTQWYDLFRGLTSEAAGAGCGSGFALASARVLLAGRAGWSYDAIAGDYLRLTTMHEIGHSLGMRHNFRASASVPFDRLFDRGWIAEHGTTPSVMDYLAADVVLDPRQQGDLYPKQVGAYDRWAIRYGYATFSPGREAEGLAAILDETGEPAHAYASDGDQWLGDLASDPATATFDLGDDPVRWARLQVALMARALPRLRETFMTGGDGYFAMRAGFDILLLLRQTSLQPLVRSVGGFTVVRDHLGQKGERPPLTPIAGPRQRAALAAIVELLLAEEANRFPRDVLEHLGPYRGAEWRWALMRGETPQVAIAYPIHQSVLAAQTAILDALVHPARLQRVQDGAAFGAADALTVSELVATLTDGIFTELLAPRPRAVGAFRRELQLAWIARLEKLARAQEPAPAKPPAVPPAPWRPTLPPIPVPADATAAAAAQLRRLERRLATLPAGGLDAVSRDHAAALLARVKAALSAAAAPRSTSCPSCPS